METGQISKLNYKLPGSACCAALLRRVGLVLSFQQGSSRRSQVRLPIPAYRLVCTICTILRCLTLTSAKQHQQHFLLTIPHFITIFSISNNIQFSIFINYWMTSSKLSHLYHFNFHQQPFDSLFTNNFVWRNGSFAGMPMKNIRALLFSVYSLGPSWVNEREKPQ